MNKCPSSLALWTAASKAKLCSAPPHDLILLLCRTERFVEAYFGKKMTNKEATPTVRWYDRAHRNCIIECQNRITGSTAITGKETKCHDLNGWTFSKRTHNAQAILHCTNHTRTVRSMTIIIWRIGISICKIPSMHIIDESVSIIIYALEIPKKKWKETCLPGNDQNVTWVLASNIFKQLTIF